MKQSFVSARRVALVHSVMRLRAHSRSDTSVAKSTFSANKSPKQLLLSCRASVASGGGGGSTVVGNSDTDGWVSVSSPSIAVTLSM